MARRYRATHSPGADAAPPRRPEPYRAARVDPAGARSNLLFIPPFLLGFRSIWSGAADLAVGLAAAGLLLLGAWLLREGLQAQAAYDARRVAKRPAIPRKIFAALACGGGTAIAAFANEPQILAALVFGAAAAALHVGAFGVDPLTDKGLDDADFQTARVARVVDDAETYLRGMREAARRAGDRQVETRVDTFVATVRDLIRAVEDDPRDLTAARKYLGVYLMGARDAAVKFADLHARTGDRQARTDFLQLMSDLEDSFGKKTQKLLLDSSADLSVEIDVLRERLQREGVYLDR